MTSEKPRNHSNAKSSHAIHSLMATMTGAACLIQALRQQGVDTVFGYPGGAIMPVYDALYQSGLKHILTRHEQGAALAAVGYARASGRTGVCLATSGPGATNLVTGIADAFLDSVPLVAITGQVSSQFIGTDAFQEVDILGITLPVVKHSYLVRHVNDIPHIVTEAFHIAQQGRPGPVLIDIPKDIALASYEGTSSKTFSPCTHKTPAPLSPQDLQRAQQLLAESRKPLLYAGGGVHMAGACEAFRAFVDVTGIPVVSTLKGLGTLPADHPLHLGMLGMHGTKHANYAVQTCDLLVCVGARFDDRATGKLSHFAPHAKVIHIDIDPSEIHKLRSAHVGLVGCVKEALKHLQRPLNIAQWQEECAQNKKQYAWDYDAPTSYVYVPEMLRMLSLLWGPDTVVACDVGQHQMWVAQHCAFHSPRNHLTSGGLGTMGFGLPAGMGAQVAFPERSVVVVSGDGSIMMNIQELATLKRYNIPVKIIVCDNQTLGMVRQWQQLFFEERYSETDLSDNPDFVQVAQAFGLQARAIEKREEVQHALEWLRDVQSPALLHVKVDRMANVWPLVPPGKANDHMMEEP
jgi:acetolactate synthase-1/2/3 large subunit